MPSRSPPDLLIASDPSLRSFKHERSGGKIRILISAFTPELARDMQHAWPLRCIGTWKCL